MNIKEKSIPAFLVKIGRVEKRRNGEPDFSRNTSRELVRLLVDHCVSDDKTLIPVGSVPWDGIEETMITISLNEGTLFGENCYLITFGVLEYDSLYHELVLRNVEIPTVRVHPRFTPDGV